MLTGHQLEPTEHYSKELFIIGSDNGLSPGRRQAIIWTNDKATSPQMFYRFTAIMVWTKGGT